MPQEYGLGRGLASLIPQKKQVQGQGQDDVQGDESLSGISPQEEKKSEFSSKWEEKLEFKKKDDLADSQDVSGEVSPEGSTGDAESFEKESVQDVAQEALVSQQEGEEVEVKEKPEESSALDDTSSEVGEVDVEKIKANPFQPRANFDEDRLEELSQSIQRHGVIQPLIVTKKDDGFELIAGERRLQAAKKAGVKKVPVVVKDVDDKEKMEWAIIENIQRHDLNPIEEAKAYKRLMDESGLHQDEVAQKMGKSRSLVANKIRLLDLPAEAQRALIEERITEGHAKAILSLSDNEKRRGLLELILKNNLTVRQTEKRSGEIEVKKHKRKVNTDPYIKELEDRLEEGLGTKVKLKKSGDGGSIVIEYYSKEELDGIMEKISPRQLTQRK